MRHLDLFSGVGCWSLAAKWMNWQTIAFVEKDKFRRRVLDKNFPGVPAYDDIITFSGTPFRGQTDIVTASFPCQPFSVAGKRSGDSDDRFLWPQTIKVVNEARPQWCVFENVAGLLSMVESDPLFGVETKEIQLFFENDDHGIDKVVERIHRRILGRILTDIEEIGYSPLRMPDGTPVILCIPACAVGAWHRRDRLWIVARDTDTMRCDGRGKQGQNKERTISAGCGDDRTFGEFAITDSKFNPDSGDPRSQGDQFTQTPGKESGSSRPVTEFFRDSHWIDAALRTCIRRVDNGAASELDFVGSRDNRSHRLKAIGDAIHPRIAYEIFKVIEAVAKSDA